MAFNVKITALLTALVLAGCGGAQSGAAADTTGQGNDATGEATAAPPGSKVFYVQDPSLNNMNAFSVTLPAKWKFDGTLLQGGQCLLAVPGLVYRATGPDGQSRAERMPSMAWEYGNGPTPPADCIPLQTAMTAQNFLKYFAGTLHVKYLGAVPVPAQVLARDAAQIQKEKARMDARMAAVHPEFHMQNPPKTTHELARAYVSFQQGTVAMKGRLDVTVDCTEVTNLPTWKVEGRPAKMVAVPATITNKCGAGVTYYSAPENQLESVLQQWDAPGMGSNNVDAYAQAWMARSDKQTQAALIQIGQDLGNTLARNAANFQHDQMVRQNMHDQFMRSMDQNFQLSQQQFWANSNARQTAASDWVDYALDRKTFMDTNTGAIYKAPNTATPGGAMQQVHGDGTP